MDDKNINAPKQTSSFGKAVLMIVIIIATLIGIYLLFAFIAGLAPSKNNRLSTTTDYYSSGNLSLPGSGGISGISDMIQEVKDSTQSEPLTPISNQSIQSKVIKTASLSLVVDNIDNAVKQITSQTSGLGGFIQNSSVSENSIGQKFGTLTLRVPATGFETLVSQIKSLAKLVEREDINGKEVTQEFIDLQSSLTHNQAVEGQYLELLKRTQSVEEIIAVRDKLDQVQAEIENIKGRLRYMGNQTEMSTITIALKTEPSIAIPAEKWQPLTILKQSFQRMIVALQNFINFIIMLVFVLISLIPYLLLIAIAVWIIRKIYKKYIKPRM